MENGNSVHSGKYHCEILRDREFVKLWEKRRRNLVSYREMLSRWKSLTLRKLQVVPHFSTDSLSLICLSPVKSTLFNRNLSLFHIHIYMYIYIRAEIYECRIHEFRNSQLHSSKVKFNCRFVTKNDNMCSESIENFEKFNFYV